MAYLDTDGWVEVERPGGVRYSFYAADRTVWVRRYDGVYKCAWLGPGATLESAAALAGIMSRETDHWLSEGDIAERGLRLPARRAIMEWWGLILLTGLAIAIVAALFWFYW